MDKNALSIKMVRDGGNAALYAQTVAELESRLKELLSFTLAIASWHRAAFVVSVPDGTYELVGPKMNGGRDGFSTHELVRHGQMLVECPARDFIGLAAWLAANQIEGIVWHHSDGRMAKIKRRDFGLKW